MMHDSSSLHESRSRMNPSLQLRKPSFNMPSVLATRQAAYGVSQQCVSHNHKVLLTWNGFRKATRDRYAGLHSHPLQRATNIWPSVAARHDVVGGANTTDLVSRAQLCAAANVWTNSDHNHLWRMTKTYLIFNIFF